MKIKKLILPVIGSLLTIAVILLFLFVNNIKKQAIPDYSEDIDLENLTEEVTVWRDSLAIPHVYAKNEEDLYRVVGYLSAEDRLWQMDLMRRITMGKLSEIFGEDMIEADQLFRSFGFSRKSQLVLQKTDPAILKCLDAYTDGVNQYIEKNKKNLSFEFSLLGYKPEAWTNIHTANLIGYMAWDLTSGWTADMAIYKIAQVVEDSLVNELLPWDNGFMTSYIYPDFILDNPEIAMNTILEKAINVINDMGVQVFQGSNNWAVSGERSETGMPLLANDMHLGFMSPGIWYQMHQVIEGQLDVTGVVLPGQPYVIAGHNQDIAWGMTNITIDNLDFYLESVNPEDTNQYKLNGRWVDMRVVEEEINVKGLDNPVYRINRFTHRGPIVSTFKGLDKTISARWLGMDYSNELRSVHLFNRASNWEEFREAASSFIAVSQNIVYADREGNIGLQAAGGVPIRNTEHMMVYPGDTTLHDWLGVVPFEDMPFTYNPENGIVSSANNKTVEENYPYYIGTWFSLPNRIDRIRELLNSREKHSIESFKAIHSDQVSAFAKRMTPFYLKLLDGKLSGKEAEALEYLKEWDYNMEKEKAAPLIYEQIFRELIVALYKDELGDPLFDQIMGNNIIARYHIYDLVDKRASGWCDDVSTPERIETLSDNVIKAFSSAVDTLSSLLGPDISQWKYGDLHTITIEHPMGGVNIVKKVFDPNLGPYAVGGSFHTVAPFSYNVGGTFEVNHGASHRHIFSTANWDDSQTVIPTGTSGIPASPFYGNQTEMYLNFKYHDDAFSKEAVKARTQFEASYY